MQFSMLMPLALASLAAASVKVLQSLHSATAQS